MGPFRASHRWPQADGERAIRQTTLGSDQNTFQGPEVTGRDGCPSVSCPHRRRDPLC